MWGQRKNNKQRLILYTGRGAVLQMSIHTLAALLGLTLISAGIMSPYDSVRKNEAPSEETQRREHRTIFVLLAVMLLLRIVYVFHYHIDSDEPQHLHVVWGWTQGLLQYRDVFDNHTPLFHLLCAPLLAVLGERPEVLYVMRLAMIPLYGLALWSTYRIGRELFSHRVGLWAAVFTGLFPGFFFCALEFRTDDLWVALWLLALALLVQGRLTLRRSLLVGVILGAAVGVSLKTTLLLAPLGAAALVAVVLTAKRRSQPWPASVSRLTMQFFGVPPDQGLTKLLLAKDAEPLVRIAAAVADWRPTLLVTPSALDCHPDHSALAVLIRFALAPLDPQVLRYTELSYLVHPRPAPHLRLHLPLRPEEQARKREAFCVTPLNCG